MGDDLQTTETEQPVPRRVLDPLALLAGLAALAVAVTVLVSGISWLPSVDLRWVFAAGAATAGVALLVGSLRSQR